MREHFDRIAASPGRSIALLVLLSGVFFIGLGHVHLFDWDEINFAESAREMIASGDHLKVQINYLPFWEKPPLFFWLQVMSMRVFGINEFAARLPNALFGVLYLLTFYSIGRRHLTARFGLLWALMFFGTILPHLYFKSGIIDPVFNYFILMSVYHVMLALGPTGLARHALVAGLFSGLSVLTKGPVGLLLVGLTAFVFLLLQRFRGFPGVRKIVLFISGFILVIAGWLVAELNQNGTGNLLRFVAYMVDLFTTGVAGHEQPFHYHFVVVLLGYFPISVLAMPYLWGGGAEDDPLRFRRWMQVLFWVVMIVFSVTTTKIVHYSSMAYAPLSFLAALFVYRLDEHRERMRRYQRWMLPALGLLWSTLFLLIPLVMLNRERIIPYIKDPFAAEGMRAALPWTGAEAIVGLVHLALVLWALHRFRKRLYLAGILLFVASTVITLLLVLFVFLPKIESATQGPAIRFYERIAAEDAYVETYGYKSYAQYYYARLPYEASTERTNMDWLLKGPIDKPVYLVTKVTETGLEAYPDIRLLGIEGGFKFHKRDPGGK
jgi:4-amino-4-deoxy-L-arabinose transferase-like glycosyltransferase